MTTKRKFIHIILFIVTLDWALWVGGQFFNALMVIPGWSHDVPRSIQWYQQNMLSHIVAYFFLVVNPVFLLVPAIIAWILCRKEKSAFRVWFGIALLLDIIITLIVGLWMAPTARHIFSAAAHGELDVASIKSSLLLWKTANAWRLGFGIITLILFLMSIFHLRPPAALDKKDLTLAPSQ